MVDTRWLAGEIHELVEKSLGFVGFEYDDIIGMASYQQAFTSGLGVGFH
jgi:hypothetical protein